LRRIGDLAANRSQRALHAMPVVVPDPPGHGMISSRLTSHPASLAERIEYFRTCAAP
jgi:hypothetical protein